MVLQVDYFRISPTPPSSTVSHSRSGICSRLHYRAGQGNRIGSRFRRTGAGRRTVRPAMCGNIKIKLNDANAERATKALTSTMPASLSASGTCHLKFVVRENISSKMGTFEHKFVVQDLSADTSGLKLNTIILSNQRNPVTSAVGQAERAKHARR